MNKFLETALKYADKGWPVFPLRQQSKKPRYPGGFHNATTDKDKIREWWTRSNLNIGVPACEDTFCVIDMDVPDGETTLKAFREEGNTLPKTMTQKTGSGGYHFLFQPNPAIGNSTGKIGQGVDTRGNGKGYIVVPPSIHPNGKEYKWSEEHSLENVPEWILKIFKKKERKKVVAPTPSNKEVPTDNIRERAIEYLDACPPAVQGQAGHNSLLWASTAMVHGFGLDDRTAFCLLRDYYNPKCVPPWDLDNKQELRDFTRKIQEAKKGCTKKYKWLVKENSFRDIDIGAEIAKNIIPPEKEDIAQITYPRTIKKKINIDDLLEPVGTVGQIAKFINSAALKKQPLLALANTLSFCGALVGRKVRDAWDLRTNLYTVGVAESCAGKEHSRQIIKRICTESGVTDLLGGEDVTSDAAIAGRLQETPACLFQWDEIGHMIASIKSDLANPIRKSVVPYLMKLTGSASSVLLGKEYSTESRIDIEQPCACLYGTTVPEVLYSGLSKSEIRDGLLGRLLIFRARDDNPKIDEEAGRRKEIPEEIINKVQFWAEYTPDPPPGTTDVKRHTGTFQVEIPVEDKATTWFRKFRRKTRRIRDKLKETTCEPLGPLWGRAEEHARKVALIVSAMDCIQPEAATITEQHAQYACRLVMYLIQEFQEEVEFSISDSAVEKSSKRIHKIVKDSGSKGLEHRRIVRKTRNLTSRYRNDIIKTLLESGLVVREKHGRTYKYYSVEFYEKTEED